MALTIGHVLCGLVLVIGSNVALWFKFASDLRFHAEQIAAMCVDGRAMGEPLTQSRLGVDDSKRHKHSVTMQCSFPVAVYPCLDEIEDLDEWSGQCRSLAAVPAFPKDEWPRRMEEPGIGCFEGDLGGDKCSDNAWSCSTGACSAYDKSIRLCAFKIRTEPYKCFVIDGRPEEGIREEASGFPIGWFMGALSCTFLSLGCLTFTMVRVSKEENCLQKTAIYVMSMIVFFGLCFAVGTIVNAAIGKEDAKGVSDYNYDDLAVTTGSELFGTNRTAVAAETPPPEGMHWAIVLLIVLGSVYGCLFLVCGCLYCFSRSDEVVAPPKADQTPTV